jgi:hypothetical protein
MPPVAARLSLALRGRWRRTLLWASLLLLLAVAQGLLVVLTVSYEASRAQDQAEAVALEAAAEVKRQVTRGIQDLQPLAWPGVDGLPWGQSAERLLQTRRDILRVERRGPGGAVTAGAEGRFGPPLFTKLRRSDVEPEIETACALARRAAAPVFTRSYFVPLEGGLGVEVMDLCMPLQAEGRATGFVVATWSLSQLLESVLSAALASGHELSFIEGDGSRGVSACRGDPARRHAVSSSATSSTRVGTVSRARTQTCANPALLTGTRSIGSDGFLSGRGSSVVDKNWAGDLAGIGILPAGRVHPHGPVMPEYCACLPER